MKQSWKKFGRQYRPLPYIVFGVMIFSFIFTALGEMKVPPQKALWLFAAGMASWTLLEYFIHRFIFHPRVPGGDPKTFAQGTHRLHHDAAQSREFLVAPILISIPMAIVTFALFYFLTWNMAATMILDSGLMFAYLIYEEFHYTAHHRQPTCPWLKAMKRYHLLHHFGDDNARFGVTSPLWDKVFGTAPSKIKAKFI